MRRYLHAPDEAWLRARYARNLGELELVRMTLEEYRSRGRVAEVLYDTAVDAAFELAQLAWGLGEPPPVVRGHLRTAGTWIDEAAEAGVRFELGQGELWLEVSILDGVVPPRLLAAALHGALRGEGTTAIIDAFMVGVARLAVGDRERAVAEVEAMKHAAPTAIPEAVPYLAGLDDLVGATATRDQGRFDAAAERRIAGFAREFDRSLEQRRHRYGLLDPRGAAVAALARREGLRVPSEYAYLGAELIDAGSA